jgi:phage gpG-like protein
MSLKEFREKKPLYKPRKSTRKGKKGMVYVKKDGKKRLIHFGDSSMKDFTQHKDPKRRKSYLARSGGIRDKSGRLTKNNKNSANYWSRRVNW